MTQDIFFMSNYSVSSTYSQYRESNHSGYCLER